MVPKTDLLYHRTMSYNPIELEAKWQNKWNDAKLHTTDLTNPKRPYYSHVMFPYPSGDKLHVGHWYNFAPADSLARFKRMQGYDVCTPMGFDAFGLPAENYAIKTGVHPNESISSNVDTMITQLKRIGCMYDWDKMVNTSRPEYYKWTQWLFTEMYKADLAYKKAANVNYCPSCKTVLANEQVWDNTCERCGTTVVQKAMSQWYWRTTAYAQELLDGLEDLDWPEQTKTMQRNWIGRSEGVTIKSTIKGTDVPFEAYDSVPQTFMAQTFAVIAPEHPDLPSMLQGKEQEAEALAFIEAIKQKKASGTFDIETDMEGMFTGLYVADPYGTGDLPLWIASFVVADYGSGMVACSAHDERDFAFAKKYDIPLRPVMFPADQEEAKKVQNLEYCFAKAEEGILQQPEQFAGRKWGEVREDIITYLEQKGIAERSVQYRLRDWTISRQRYWGAPIPVVYDPNGNPHLIPAEHLPWQLPTDIDFNPDGTAPLARSKELHDRVVKIFGAGWTPEYDTMDTFVCSSFYSFMYLGHPLAAEGVGPPTTEFINPVIEKDWLPVQKYIGGPEHACMHLIYARFVTKALKSMGHVQTAEPYQGLIHQGLITNQGAKMSKSKGNAVSPDSFVEEYGSDIFRMYLMFMGPFTQGGDWSDTGIKGVDRFAKRVYVLVTERTKPTVTDTNALTVKLHSTIKKITENMEDLQFNTSLAALMELINASDKQDSVSVEFANTFVQLLAPLAPHLADELWHRLANESFIVQTVWPSYDESLLVADTVTIVVQINGKVRAELQVDAAISAADAIALAKASPNVQKYTNGVAIKKEIYVPQKLVSLVV